MSSSWPEGRSAERVADGLALSILGVVAIIAALTFRDYGLGWDDYTHAEYGGLLLQSLFVRLFRPARAVLRQSLCLWRRLRHAVRARRQGAAVRPVRDEAAGRRHRRADRHVHHLAPGAPGRRPARRTHCRRLAGHLPALLRQHVHEREGLPLRGRDGVPDARAGARLRGISAAVADHLCDGGHRRRSRHRHPRARRACRDQCARGACPGLRGGDPPRRPARSGRPSRRLRRPLRAGTPASAMR